MGTQKCQSLDHLVDAIRDVRKIKFFTEPCMGMHQRYIHLYGKTLRKKCSAMDETVERYSGKVLKNT